MTRRHALLASALLVTLGLGLLAGCAGVKAPASKVKLKGAGPYSSVFVLGATGNEDTRQLFEAATARALRDEGVKPVESFDLMGDVDEFTREVCEPFVRESGAEAALAVRVVDFSTKSGYNYEEGPLGLDPYYRDFYSYSFEGGLTGTGEVSFGTRVKVQVEGALYDVKSGKLAWVSHTKVVNPNGDEKVIEDLAEALVKRMRADGMLR